MAFLHTFFWVTIHNSFYCTVFHWASQILHFYILKICGNPVLKHVYWHHFSNNICSLWVCVKYIITKNTGNSHNILNFFIIISVRVIYDQWFFDVTIVLIFGCQEQCPYKSMNLINKGCMCSNYSTDWLFPIFHCLLMPIVMSEHMTILKLGQLVILYCERKSHMSFNLNQKFKKKWWSLERKACQKPK